MSDETAKSITVPAVIWTLGDREQFTTGGVTRSVRPLYFRPDGSTRAMRVGSIDPDYAEPLMAALSGRTSGE